MTDQLPAKPEQKPTSRQTSLTQEIWTGSAGAVADLLAQEPMTAEEIVQRLAVVRVTYFVPEMTVQERRAWHGRFIAALENIPHRFAAEAFDWWNETATKRPTPGDIATRARSMMDQARESIRLASKPERREETELEPIDPELLARRAAIASEYGFDLPSSRAALKVISGGRRDSE